MENFSEFLLDDTVPVVTSNVPVATVATTELELEATTELLSNSAIAKYLEADANLSITSQGEVTPSTNDIYIPEVDLSISRFEVRTDAIVNPPTAVTFTAINE